MLGKVDANDRDAPGQIFRQWAEGPPPVSQGVLSVLFETDQGTMSRVMSGEIEQPNDRIRLLASWLVGQDLWAGPGLPRSLVSFFRGTGAGIDPIMKFRIVRCAISCVEWRKSNPPEPTWSAIHLALSAATPTDSLQLDMLSLRLRPAQF